MQIRKGVVTAVAFLGLCGTLFAGGGDPAVPNPTGLNIAAGFDLFQTLPGTQFDFTAASGGVFGIVPFVGVPIGGIWGQTDTIVRRNGDAAVNGSAIPIQLLYLSLQSSQPVQLGNTGFFYNASVRLDPSAGSGCPVGLADNNGCGDNGQMTISGNSSGGTFNSFFDVFFDVNFTPVNGGPPLPTIMDDPLLAGNGNSWTTSAANGGVRINGNDDGTTCAPVLPGSVPNIGCDQNANTHTGLGTNEFDFFPGTTPGVPFSMPVPIMEAKPASNSMHFATTAQFAPEPSTIVLALSALAGIAVVRRRRVQ